MDRARARPYPAAPRASPDDPAPPAHGTSPLSGCRLRARAGTVCPRNTAVSILGGRLIARGGAAHQTEVHRIGPTFPASHDLQVRPVPETLVTAIDIPRVDVPAFVRILEGAGC